MAQITKRRAPMVFRILLLVFLVYAVVTLIKLQMQITEKREQLGSLEHRIEQYDMSNQKLQQQMKEGISEEDIGELARTELNYAEPGERVFVDTSRRQ